MPSPTVPDSPPNAALPPRQSRGRGRGRRFLRLLGWLTLGLAACLFAIWITPFWGFPFNASRHTRVPITPPWALECWIWEDDANNAEAVRELLDGFEQHDIPVRTVLIDSPWSTRYNDFVMDPKRYPEPTAFIRSIKARGCRVVLWMTCMVNDQNKDTAIQESPDFHQFARDRGFLAGNGERTRWWKGRGGFIDYTQAAALEWWHSQQRPLLEAGIDGWKLDGTDSLFLSRGFLPWKKTAAGWLTTRSYMDLYNREEYRNGLRFNPEFILLTRAIDHRYFPFSHPEGHAPFDAAPVTWVGDRTHEWSSKRAADGTEADAMHDAGSLLDRGFEGALRDILASAAKGYCVVGDDVAGYHGREPIPPRLYIRWAQFAAFTGLFLNGGHGERRLWKRSTEELDIIRRYAWLHTELVPYMFSHVVQCHEGGLPLIRPEGDRYQFRFGDDLFVAPVYRDSNRVTFDLPRGRWRRWLADQEILEGPITLSRDFALGDFPVFVRDGAIIPLNVTRPYTGFGDRESQGFLTWDIHPHGSSAFTLHNTDRSGTTRVAVNEGPPLLIDLEGIHKPHILRIRRDTAPSQVQLDDRTLTPGIDWRHDAADHRLYIRTKDYVRGHYEVR